MQIFLKEAARVVPSQKQMDWFDLEQYAFIHFGVNTFTDREWGDGTENEEIFNPTELDCDQWVQAVKSAGLKGIVLTAKHHDGFCLWPSAYTEHSVKNSPYKGDVVKEVSDACRRGGIKFGFYLSPWDRNSVYYGTPEYNDYFCNQLTELLTNYGEIFYVWFDGACGEGKNGKKQEYDFDRYIRLIHKYQPSAVIFGDGGPDIRWCGNEAGKGRMAEWAVVPGELGSRAVVQTGKGPLCDKGNLSYLYNSNKKIGDTNQIMYSKGLVFLPSEVDTSIRPGWFWHENEDPKSTEELFNIYLNSVGNNACLHLNIPPNRKGLIDEKDVKRLKEYGDLLKKTFDNPVNCTIEKAECAPEQQPEFVITLDRSVKKINYVVISEDLTQGQRVEDFLIYSMDFLGRDFPLYQGNCIGNKKICRLVDPFEEQNPLLCVAEDTTKLVLKITSSRDVPAIKDIKVY